MELNDTVQVTLTDDGAHVLNKLNRRLNKIMPVRKLRTDYTEGEVYKSELWEIMASFGNECGPGGDLVFTNLEKA